MNTAVNQPHHDPEAAALARAYGVLLKLAEKRQQAQERPETAVNQKQGGERYERK